MALTGPARDVALEVLVHGPLSRRDLARRLELSPATMTRIGAQLIGVGLLREVTEFPGVGAGTVGRPIRPLDIVASARHFVGIKLTDTAAHGVLTDLRATPQARTSRNLADLSPQEVAGCVAQVVADLTSASTAPTALGISLGGQTLDHRTIDRAPFLHWGRVPFAELVETATGVPTVLENDVVALTGAEHWFGPARHLERFAVITIGIGVGYGLVIHDRLVTSPDAGVGLLGHFPLESTGPVCPAGHRGCAEALLSIPAIETEASLAMRRGVDYHEVMALASAGDPAATVIVNRSARALGRLVAAVANLTMAECVIVTGEGIELAQVARAAVDAGLEQDRDPAASAVDLRIETDNIDQWARGAAAIAIQRYVLDGMHPRDNVGGRAADAATPAVEA